MIGRRMGRAGGDVAPEWLPPPAPPRRVDGGGRVTSRPDLGPAPRLPLVAVAVMLTVASKTAAAALALPCAPSAEPYMGGALYECSDLGLAAFPAVAPNTTRLILNANLVTAVPAQLFTDATRLRYLWVNHNRVAALPAGLLAGAAELEALYLGANRLTSIGTGVFADTPRLRRLDLSRNLLTTIEDGAFAGLTSVEKLWLFGNHMVKMPKQAFAAMDRLRILNVAQNVMQCTIEDAALMAAPFCNGCGSGLGYTQDATHMCCLNVSGHTASQFTCDGQLALFSINPDAGGGVINVSADVQCAHGPNGITCWRRGEQMPDWARDMPAAQEALGSLDAAGSTRGDQRELEGPDATAQALFAAAGVLSLVATALYVMYRKERAGTALQEGKLLASLPSEAAQLRPDVVRNRARILRAEQVGRAAAVGAPVDDDPFNPVKPPRTSTDAEAALAIEEITDAAAAARAADPNPRQLPSMADGLGRPPSRGRKKQARFKVNSVVGGSGRDRHRSVTNALTEGGVPLKTAGRKARRVASTDTEAELSPVPRSPPRTPSRSTMPGMLGGGETGAEGSLRSTSTSSVDTGDLNSLSSATLGSSIRSGTTSQTARQGAGTPQSSIRSSSGALDDDGSDKQASDVTYATIAPRSDSRVSSRVSDPRGSSHVDSREGDRRARNAGPNPGTPVSRLSSSRDELGIPSTSSRISSPSAARRNSGGNVEDSIGIETFLGSDKQASDVTYATSSPSAARRNSGGNVEDSIGIETFLQQTATQSKNAKGSDPTY